MNFLIVLLILFLSSCNLGATSSEYSLKPVLPKTFEKLSSVVKQSVENNFEYPMDQHKT